MREYLVRFIPLKKLKDRVDDRRSSAGFWGVPGTVTLKFQAPHDSTRFSTATISTTGPLAVLYKVPPFYPFGTAVGLPLIEYKGGTHTSSSSGISLTVQSLCLVFHVVWALPLTEYMCGTQTSSPAPFLTVSDFAFSNNQKNFKPSKEFQVIRF